MSCSSPAMKASSPGTCQRRSLSSRAATALVNVCRQYQPSVRASIPAYSPLGRLKPSTNSFKGFVPRKARAWFRSEMTRVRLKSELLTTRRILPVRAGSFSMHSFSA